MNSISDSLFATIFRLAVRPKITPTVRTGPFISPRSKKAGGVQLITPLHLDTKSGMHVPRVPLRRGSRPQEQRSRILAEWIQFPPSTKQIIALYLAQSKRKPIFRYLPVLKSTVCIKWIYNREDVPARTSVYPGSNLGRRPATLTTIFVVLPSPDKMYNNDFNR
jgi:hypothetical protein